MFATQSHQVCLVEPPIFGTNHAHQTKMQDSTSLPRHESMYIMSYSTATWKWKYKACTSVSFFKQFLNTFTSPIHPIIHITYCLLLIRSTILQQANQWAHCLHHYQTIPPKISSKIICLTFFPFCILRNVLKSKETTKDR